MGTEAKNKVDSQEETSWREHWDQGQCKNASTPLELYSAQLLGWHDKGGWERLLHPSPFSSLDVSPLGLLPGVRSPRRHLVLMPDTKLLGNLEQIASPSELCFPASAFLPSGWHAGHLDYAGERAWEAWLLGGRTALEGPVLQPSR